MISARSINDSQFFVKLRQRMGSDAPSEVRAAGNVALLGLPKSALFCSARSPGRAILAAHDQAARWRDEGRCVISGFHSSIEGECLRILLRGHQPVIVCPARGLDNMRMRDDWRVALEEERLLALSPFAGSEKRANKNLAARRNRFVAALADEVTFAYITPGGQLDHLSQLVEAWGIPQKRLI